MPPPKSERSQPKLKAILVALDMAKHTLQLTQGKAFWLQPPESVRNQLLTKTEAALKDAMGEDAKLTVSLLPAFQRHPLAERIDNIAIGIVELAWNANNVNVSRGRDSWELRSQKQREAIRKHNDLLFVMQLAKRVFHLSARKMDFWVGLVLQSEALMKAWHEGDVKRYGASAPNARGEAR